MVEHDNIKSKKNEVKGSKRLYFCWAKLAMGEPVALKYFIHNGQIFRDGWTSISINSSPPNMGVYRQSGNDIHDGHEKIIWWRPPETRMEPRKQNHLFIRTFFVKLNNCVYVCVCWRAHCKMIRTWLPIHIVITVASAKTPKSGMLICFACQMFL